MFLLSFFACWFFSFRHISDGIELEDRNQDQELLQFRQCGRLADHVGYSYLSGSTLQDHFAIDQSDCSVYSLGLIVIGHCSFDPKK